MAAIDLTARARKYSLYIPSVQIGSAEKVCMTADEWQDTLLPCGLVPADFNFLDPANKYFSYLYALASAENFKDGTNNAITSCDPAAFILGDSGGFQIGKGTFGEARKWKGFSERKVSAAWRQSTILGDNTEWCEIYCNYAMTTDLPLWVRRARNKGTPFHRCSVATLLELTVENLEYLQRVLDRRCKYLNVLQGDKPSEEEEWFRRVSPFKFDGWSLAGGVGVNGGPFRVLNRLLIMRHRKLLDPGFDLLHLLMLSQYSWAPIMTAVQMGVRKFVKNKKFTVSYDSSTPYRMGGQYEKYFEARPFTSDPRTWSNWDHKLPSTYGFLSPKFALNTTTCSRNKCAMCARKKPHLPAPFTSPIAKNLCMSDFITNKNNHARRRVKTLFDETIINHNVYVLVDGMIRANEAVFGTKENAPPELIDAVGIIKDDLFRVENWRDLLNKNRSLLEEAVGFKAGKDVL